jgi:hypothetical protein
MLSLANLFPTEAEIQESKKSSRTNSATRDRRSLHPHYHRWSRMHASCYNQGSEMYHAVGAHGIEVEWEWHKDNPEGFANFARWITEAVDEWEKATFGKVFSLRRRNTDLDFGPENCFVGDLHDASTYTVRKKLDGKKVLEFRQYAMNHTRAELVQKAKDEGYSAATVVVAVKGRTWKHLNTKL